MDADTHKIIEVGQEMRKFQKAYFKNRSQDDLHSAKRLELRFDRLVVELKAGKTDMLPFKD